MNAEKQASIIALANANGIDTDNEGDIFGSTNGALLKFAEALLAGRVKPEAREIPAPPPPPATRFVRDDRPPAPDQTSTAGSAKGGITSTESGSDLAPTTSTVSAPTEQAKPWSASEALLYAARVVELYDDATMADDYMIDSKDCAAILTALATMPMFAPSSTEGAQKAPEEVRLIAYDPNIRWAEQRVRLTLKQWDYTATLETTVGSNCQGFEIFDSAISNAWEALPTRGEDMAYATLTRPNGDELECEDDELKGEDWLKQLVVGIEIVGQEPKRTSSTDQANADTGSAA